MKNNLCKTSCLLIVMLISFLSYSQTTIIASDDAYTWDSYPANNYGTKRLITSNDSDNSSTDHTREVYLKFSLSSIPTVVSAKLRLTIESTITTTRNYKAYLVPNTNSWTNSNITWNKATNFTGVSEIVSGNHLGNLIEFDITSAVSNAKANNETSISIKIVSTEEDISTFIYSTNTTTSNAEKPRLVINETTLSLDNELNSEITNVFVFPNPTSDKLYIKGIENIETTINIYSAMGQLLKQEKYNSSVDLSTFKTGLYYVKISNTQNQKTFSILKK
ncbi:DNRLRE domain-containing protein [Lutibacter sp. TH_r2]|uniref:CBM96 family carbohydrate-binding protein n=1 Tax=Lutibacter sp. TH_r2 TaxID=3082083 RepID=UPI002953FDA1|nr:DNRLRE domain-containing protein [Lutibacter sp. TH_r2]MDV7188318.1 DNRLRE domain-containing protein [Lutibacter sp. TH_r2]